MGLRRQFRWRQRGRGEGLEGCEAAQASREEASKKRDEGPDERP